MKKIMLLISGVFLLGTVELPGQCTTWNTLDPAQKEEAENLHVTYRDFIKREDYDGAFAQWQKAFDLAPAADGLRDDHYVDGVAIYKHKFQQATDDEKKKEFMEKAVALYDQAIQCYLDKAIQIPNCNEQACINRTVGLLYGQKAYDLFYTFNSPYSATREALDNAIKYAGKDNLYTIFMPYATIAVYEFQKGRMQKEEVRDVYDILNEIADFNVENNQDYGEYFQQAKDAMNGKFAEIESEIFDCAYFKQKLEPEYRANPENLDVLKYVYNKLTQEGCDKEDPFLVELSARYEKFAAEENARRMAEFEEANPSFAAKRLYDEGNYSEAINKYREAIDQETDDTKKGEYWFAIASIQFRKMDQLSTARESAYKAARLKENWGRPYMLIGEMYAQSSRNCGDDAFERGLAVIAAINKWSQARSVDPDVSDEASDLISRYSKYKPPKEDIFQRGADGKSYKVGCWIGETVTVSL